MLEQSIQLTIADGIVHQLIKHGIDTVFTVSGGGCIYLINALRNYKDKINTVVVGHEQAAVMAMMLLS